MTITEEQSVGLAAKDDERLAYDKAAHAVAMWKLGYGIERVTIDPSEH